MAAESFADQPQRAEDREAVSEQQTPALLD
jgi:hypothetical protein